MDLTGVRAHYLILPGYLMNIGEFRPITAKAMTTPNKNINTQVTITADLISFLVLFRLLPTMTTIAEITALRVI